MSVPGRTLHAGTAIGEVLVLGEPLSFWGGLDPARGIIIDQAHPQVGESITGKIVAMAGSRGSSGTPGVLGESLRNGTGPAALLITKADANLVAGALVAAALYGTICPVIEISHATFDELQTGQHLDLSDSNSQQ